jgi:hypothetical protein
MKWTALSLLALIPIAAGCGTTVPAPEGKAKDNPVVNTPVAPVEGNSQPPSDPGPPVGVSSEPPPQQAPFGTSKARLVDYAEARKNPKVVPANTKIDASDPLTASYQSYFSIGSRATIVAFKHNLNIQKQLNDNKWPSFEEFSKLAKQSRIDFAPILPWQMIGYDQSNGSLVLLEDKGDKIQRYKAKGIPLDEADKPFDTE